MFDRNTQFLQVASTLMNHLDQRYAIAKLEARSPLKTELDKAAMTFLVMRGKILDHEITCTADHVAKIQWLQTQVEQAIDSPDLLRVANRLAGLLAVL